MGYFLFTGFLVPTFVSLFLLYTRKKPWCTDTVRWTICALCLIVSVAGIVTGEKYGMDRSIYVASLHFAAPAFFNLLDRLFKRISMNVYQRDFYLYIRGSDDIDYKLFGKNPHVTKWDVVFSFTLAFGIVATQIVVILNY